MCDKKAAKTDTKPQFFTIYNRNWIEMLEVICGHNTTNIYCWPTYLVDLHQHFVWMRTKHTLHDHFYTRLQIFIRISPTL